MSGALTYQFDIVIPGKATVESTSQPHLAAVPDALAAGLAQQGDRLACHARHYSEQDGTRETAYRDETAIVGSHALHEVVVVPRPYQPNVVWVDRFHFVAAAVDPSLGGRLLGLYVGSRGTITTVVYPPSVAHQVTQVMWHAPNSGSTDVLLDSAMTSGCRFAVTYEERSPNAVQMRCAAPLAQQMAAALQQLASRA